MRLITLNLLLYPLTDFIDSHAIVNSTPTYWYVGKNPHTGDLLQLPRTQAVEAIAQSLMAQLASDERYDREGKMYGVLLVESNKGERFILKAFSGLLNGEATISGWVPPIPGRERVAAAETETLGDLTAMKQELIELDRSAERERYKLLAAEFTDKLDLLAIEHRHRKEFRQQERARLTATLQDRSLEIALHQLEEHSRQDKRERRQLKQERDRVLQPLQAILDQTDARIRELKQQRKIRSRQLQTQMHDAYRLMNFLGTSASLQELMPAGMPTGTGDCCAPKLLHYAATHQLKPIAMAEFWWGSGRYGELGVGSWERKRRGEFYGACVERCQPLMGFMLAGLSSQPQDLSIIYEDKYLIAIDKPAGLLSVPGRYLDRQDSVHTRLKQLFPGEEIFTLHRLDRDTSGILLLARDRQTYKHLTRQFHDRHVNKIYEAILGGNIERPSGSIDLPLWGDPDDRPRQIVDFDRGKPSQTKFHVLEKVGNYTRIEFQPISGRTHQIRVHAADPRGLGVAILGDRLYGCQADVKRLHLHARDIIFSHPDSLAQIRLQTHCPF